MADRPVQFTHAHDGDLAVFLIGARLNKPLRVDIWFPVVTAMSRMLTELETDKANDGSLGFLGARSLVGGRGPTVVQYWRSLEDIYAYANAPDLAHRPAWREFYQRARGAGGAVGIWHETYSVPAGHHESLYVDMPETGLSKAFGSVPMTRRGRTARDRLASTLA